MNITCQCGQMANIADMRFLVQYCLIQMGDAPALRNVKLEQIGEFLGCLSGDCVSPRAEWNEQLSILIECQVAMHHGAETNGANILERHVVLLQNLVTEISIAFLQTGPNIFETVRPDSVFVSVFPLIASSGDRRMIFTDQYCLDARRAKLNAESGFSALNCFLY